MILHKKAVVLGGKTGLVGQALVKTLEKANWEVHSLSRDDVDYTQKDSAPLLESILRRLEPVCVFNTVAFTNVDAAEDDPENATLLNRTLPATLARLAKDLPFILVHYSTDFVFNGKKDQPYTPDDKPDPINLYGQSKLAGEEAIIARELDRYLIIRTSWVFGPGRRNFISAILEKCRNKEGLRIVHDQIGSPTYSEDLAAYSLKLLESGVSGLFHIANSGRASRCELADEAVDLSQFECSVTPVTSQDFPQKAKRPRQTVLDCSSFTKATGIVPRPWPQALRDYIFTHFNDNSPT